MKRNSFVFHRGFIEGIEHLSDEDKLKTLLDIIYYALDGELPTSNDVAGGAFYMTKPQIDRDYKKYEETCEKRREAGRKGGLERASKAKQKQAKLANASKGKQSKQIQDDNDYEYDNDNVYENDNDNEIINNTPLNPLKGKKFIPPTANEVREYCINGGYNIDSDAFIDFYASKGWMVGKNKMKDWKAAVRNWARSENRKPRQEKTADVFEEWRNA